MTDPKVQTVATLKALSVRALTAIAEAERLAVELDKHTDQLQALIDAEREGLDVERD